MGDDNMIGLDGHLITDNPRRTVTLDGYWIYKNLVTVKQYRAFCDATSRKMPDVPS